MEGQGMRLLMLLGVLSLLVASILLGQCRSAGHAGDTKHVAVRPDEVKYVNPADDPRKSKGKE
jgi:hypothetical protein